MNFIHIFTQIYYWVDFIENTFKISESRTRSVFLMLHGDGIDVNTSYTITIKLCYFFTVGNDELPVVVEGELVALSNYTVSESDGGIHEQRN